MSQDAFLRVLRGWQGFYALLGGASATLAGLMFVAASLGASMLTDDSLPRARTFLTPPVVYFSLVLLLCALMNVPTQTRPALAGEVAAVGLTGAGYTLSHLGRLQGFYRDGTLAWQTWIWNLALPLFAALCLLGAALGLSRPAAPRRDRDPSRP